MRLFSFGITTFSDHAIGSMTTVYGHRETHCMHIMGLVFMLFELSTNLQIILLILIGSFRCNLCVHLWRKPPVVSGQQVKN